MKDTLNKLYLFIPQTYHDYENRFVISYHIFNV